MISILLSLTEPRVNRSGQRVIDRRSIDTKAALSETVRELYFGPVGAEPYAPHNSPE